PQPSGACCATGATVCTVTTQAACAGTFVGVGAACTGAACSGSCCNGTGGCQTATHADCDFFGGSYVGNGVACGASSTCPSGACCATGGSGCTIGTALTCTGAGAF